MKRVALFTAAVCLAVSPAFAGETVIEEIVVRVNNQIITRSELQRGREQMLNELRQQNINDTDPKALEAERNLLRDMIDQQLLLDKAKELGLTGDTELVKKLDDIRKQLNLETIDDLEKVAQQQGVSFEDFKQNLRNNILTQQVIGKEVGSKIQITAEEQKQFYEEHKKEIEQPEHVRLSEILISTQPAGKEAQGMEDPQAVAAAEQKAQQLLQTIRSGGSFEEQAKANSNGPTAKEGGDLGNFKRGSLSKELEDKVFAMKPGEVSDVIHTKQGFVILKVTEHEQAGVPSLKKVEPQVQDAIYMKKLQPKLREYLTKLREQAFIDLKPGFVDTGASPNQTKPVVTTASSSTGSGKLKKKKRFGVF